MAARRERRGGMGISPGRISEPVAHLVTAAAGATLGIIGYVGAGLSAVWAVVLAVASAVLAVAARWVFGMAERHPTPSDTVDAIEAMVHPQRDVAQDYPYR